MLEPHTAAELSPDDIEKMVLEMIDAHGEYMAMYHCVISVKKTQSYFPGHSVVLLLFLNITGTKAQTEDNSCLGLCASC